jgi:L-threonine-O-3-phosphate decarboxylase
VPFELRPQLGDCAPVTHGSAIPDELRAAGLDPSETVDFSVSTNPLGPPPGALAAVSALEAGDVWHYPDPSAARLRRALAESLGLDPDALVAGNGSAELIWSLALAGVRPAPEGVLVVGPTFGEYRRASQLLGAVVRQERADPSAGFRLDVPRLAGQIRRQRPRLVWLCNPNNPTGSYLPRGDVEALLQACAGAGALLVVDEAYLAFVEAPHSLLDLLATGSLCLLRSLTKDYALAGLRLGYAVATPELARALRLTQPPWSVNAAAQVAGVAALADAEHLRRARREVGAARAVLVAGLRELGYRVSPPAANFVLVEVGDAPSFRAALLGRGCVVRDGTSFGLPGHVRIGVRTRPECDRLLAAIAAVRERGD